MPCWWGEGPRLDPAYECDPPSGQETRQRLQGERRADALLSPIVRTRGAEGKRDEVRLVLYQVDDVLLMESVVSIQ